MNVEAQLTLKLCWSCQAPALIINGTVQGSHEVDVAAMTITPHDESCPHRPSHGAVPR